MSRYVLFALLYHDIAHCERLPSIPGCHTYTFFQYQHYTAVNGVLNFLPIIQANQYLINAIGTICSTYYCIYRKKQVFTYIFVEAKRMSQLFVQVSKGGLLLSNNVKFALFYHDIAHCECLPSIPGSHTYTLSQCQLRFFKKEH